MNKYIFLIGFVFVQFYCINYRVAELHRAVLNDNIKEVKQFINRHPKLINAPDVAYGGWPALFYAAYFGNERIVQLLVKHGANTQLSDITNQTALDYAQQQRHDRIATFLLLYVG